MMGAERRSMVMTEEEKRLTAYHEFGHALVGYFSPASDPIHKATIIPRGRALGMVMRLPEGDRISVSREKLKADIAVAMGGRVAEELIFGYDKVTAGAASDIEQATKIARHMVTQWGMSDKLGPMAYGENQQEVFLGHSITQSQERLRGDRAADRRRDPPARRRAAIGTAQTIIASNLERLHDLANALLEHETLTGEEVGAVLRGEPMPKSAAAGAAERRGAERRQARLGADHRAAQGRHRRHGAEPAAGRLTRSRGRRAARDAAGPADPPELSLARGRRVLAAPGLSAPARRPRGRGARRGASPAAGRCRSATPGGLHRPVRSGAASGDADRARESCRSAGSRPGRSAAGRPRSRRRSSERLAAPERAAGWPAGLPRAPPADHGRGQRHPRQLLRRRALPRAGRRDRPGRCAARRRRRHRRRRRRVDAARRRRRSPPTRRSAAWCR